MKSRIFIILYALICLCVVFSNANRWKDKILVFDVSGYHLYLPATIIYNDLGRLTFYTHINGRYFPGGWLNWNWYEIFDQPTGQRLNKYAIGVSVMECPFFLIAHGYNLITKQDLPDGYSLPYQYGAIFSNIFWVAVGLYYLRRALKIYYDDTIVLLTLIAIALATNLYHYTANSHGMSHPYSFALIAAAVYYTDAWYRNQRRNDILMLGLAVGLIVIVRPVNAVFAMVPVLWRVSSLEDLRLRIKLFVAHYKTILLSLFIFLAIVFIQLGYWKYVTGHWIYNSYNREPFVWSEPRILHGLFGFRKGWFVYSPIAFIAVLGFINLWRQDKKLTPVLVTYLAITIYVTFSWWCWWYGGGFGCRPLVDSLAVVALPFAAFAKDVMSNRKKIFHIGLVALVVILSGLSMFQSYQTERNIIHSENMTRKYYWKVFGQWEFSGKYGNYLLDKQYLKEEHERRKRQK
ncbi:MAG: hypothetical protein EOP56_13795 [Sphingobacteriales bacterium]|nr:MAG: hypothetical protein EOP56_13795 [Sphingobacteriales bacterium]